jgi:tetratricopeptide (TPR) repeat protein
MKLREFIYRCGLAAAMLFLLSSLSLAQTNPPAFDDLVAKAAAAREQGRTDEAIGLYQQAVQLNPKWADGWWFLGSLQYGADAYAAARDALTRYLELSPEAGPAFALRGLCEFETFEYDQSLKDLQRGLALGAANQARNEKILRYHEALLLAHSGNFEAALQRYAVLARGGVPNPELLVGVGLAGLRTPLLPQELGADRMLLFMSAGKAAVLFWSGDHTGAQKAFQNLFQNFPAAANAHYFYGYLLFPMDPDEAIVEFRKELEISPANASAETMVAWDALIRNDYPEALVYAQKAVAQDPTLPVGQLVLGRALVETGDVKSGIEHLEKELQLEPDNFETHLALAKAYSKSGRSEDARRERLYCLQIAQSSPTQGGTPQSARP